MRVNPEAPVSEGKGKYAEAGQNPKSKINKIQGRYLRIETPFDCKIIACEEINLN
jgi:hypothetical protein